MMKFIQSFINRVSSRTPRNPNEFVKKFMEDSDKERAQLEMIYKNNAILQVDPLKFVPSWFKFVNKNEQEYNNGYVLFFVQDKDDFTSNGMEKKLEFNNGKGFLKIDEFHGKDPVITIAKLIPETKDYLSLGIEMRKFIDTFYSFKERNPSILFNIRYLEDVKG